MTSNDTLLPCEHCGCRFGYHEAGCAALVDDIVSVAVTGFKDDVKRIMADHDEPPILFSNTSPHGLPSAFNPDSRVRRTPPTPATDAREAVARAIEIADAHPSHQQDHAADNMPDDISDWGIYLADAALSALAQIRAQEIAAARAEEQGYRHTQVAALKQVHAAEILAAEARATAAERERDALREALDDLLTWFPKTPSPPEWRISAGKYGADDAVAAARAALTANHSAPVVD